MSVIFCCCDKIPQQKRERVYFAHKSRLWFIMTKKSQRQEPERTDHISPVKSREQGVCHAGAQAAFSSSFIEVLSSGNDATMNSVKTILHTFSEIP